MKYQSSDWNFTQKDKQRIVGDKFSLSVAGIEISSHGLR